MLFRSRAGREKELLDRVVQRDAYAKKMVSLVFRTHLAMAKKDFPEAKKLLEECREQFDAEVPRWDIEAACYAAIPAFEIDELREAALPILEAFLEQEKTTGIYPASDLQLFKLSREIQAYLDEKKTR